MASEVSSHRRCVMVDLRSVMLLLGMGKGGTVYSYVLLVATCWNLVGVMADAVVAIATAVLKHLYIFTTI